ncbi:MAG: GNAT family N-acetyltransferase [Clostridiales bacterium]|nr:GNAT family N-acetyltransferase [Clostridiales bacterium]
MEIRKLKPEEIYTSEMLESLSFVFRLREDREKELEEENYKPDHWGYFDDNGKLTATLTNHDLPIFLDGCIAPARGVGGVASDPVSRGQGHVRALFAHVLKADRESGMLFSALYPFSHAFYRKFGYELCFENKKVRFPTQALKIYRSQDPPQARLLYPKDGTAALHPVYDAFARRYTFAVARNEHTWSRLEIADPMKAEKYWYVLSRDGRDTAYVVFYYRPGDKPFIRTLCVHDYAFTDTRAFYDLMGFLHRYAAQAKDIELYLPDGLPLSALADNPYAIEISVSHRPMARVVNVEKVIAAMRHPGEDGAYTIFVEDSFLPENEGCYAVGYKKSGAVSVERKEGEADLRLSVGTFTQLALGFLDLGEAAYKHDVKISDNEATLKKVFVKKPIFLWDFY